MPGLNGEQWPDHVAKEFRRTIHNIAEPWNNYMYYSITGMTFSGHPFTTYYNTSASLCYASYYLNKCKLDGYRHFYWAAGDDLVVWHELDISA